MDIVYTSYRFVETNGKENWKMIILLLTLVFTDSNKYNWIKLLDVTGTCVTGLMSSFSCFLNIAGWSIARKFRAMRWTPMNWRLALKKWHCESYSLNLIWSIGIAGFSCLKNLITDVWFLTKLSRCWSSFYRYLPEFEYTLRDFSSCPFTKPAVRLHNAVSACWS